MNERKMIIHRSMYEDIDYIVVQYLRYDYNKHDNIYMRPYLCGYAKIKDDSTLYFKSYDDEVYNDLDIHGGLTFKGNLGDFTTDKQSIEFDNNKDNKNCHWIGFDCNHCYDNILKQNKSYVIDECVKLCEFIHNQGKKKTAEIKITNVYPKKT